MSNARNLSNLLGTGTTIATASIADDAVTSAKIADDAVVSAALATDAVGADALSSSAIASGDLPTGSILQVVQSTKTATQVIDASSYTDVSDLSVSITPASTSNKILVMVTVSTSVSGSGGSFFRLVRGSTAIAIGTDSNSNNKTTFEVDNAGTPGDGTMTGGMNFLDAPSTTSATTYKLQGHRGSDSAGRLNINRSNNYPASTTFDTNSVSTITVMEVVA